MLCVTFVTYPMLHLSHTVCYTCHTRHVTNVTQGVMFSRFLLLLLQHYSFFLHAVHFNDNRLIKMNVAHMLCFLNSWHRI